MADFSFEREVRTPYSEAYTIHEEDRTVGRVDIHFADGVVHLAVAVDESLTQDAIQEIIDTIESGDIAHPGTFNANPLSAAAGIKALELVATTPVNDTANARSDQLKRGLNDMLTRLEIPGCCSGVASLLFLRLGVDHECDKEVCVLSHDDMRTTTDAARNQQLNLALLNHGVQAGVRFILTAAHSEKDIDDTVDAFEKSLTEVREIGLL